ncbi:HD domain-containing protein [Carboxydothermus hydrogenoformans]|uniref:HD domain protein n=1 Tax=Carboxydothermus hydrogenoformans (strain ATCC BAA-161 / DSM 6008 / Z-2901) TaxID=246194 RepID=Q3A998_CARHZ|nr:HD domain-containing protein [Carboxydothermus hydrogenoformans]ABB13948.1 HD domain protein [Carboxydothermus hydrogenoformans Z-2901]
MYKEKYIEAMKNYFGDDTRRINHALKVLNYAERIMEGENIEGDLKKIITITAILHDIGIIVAEQKYNSSAGKYQEIEGPPIAREIMVKNNEDKSIIERVCYIIGGHHTAEKNDGLDFQIIWEADLLVNIEEDGLDKNKENVKKIIEKNFKTNTGRNIAVKTYL